MATGKFSNRSSVQSLSHARLFATTQTATCQASLSITSSQSLLKLMSIKSVMPSNHLILCRLLLLLHLIFPNIRIFSSESVLHIRWPKYWSFSFSISPSNEYLRTDLLQDGLVRSPCSPRGSQESPPTPQFKSINSLALTLLYSPTLTSIHDYWKNHSFDCTVGKAMSLIFNTLFRFVIAFLPRSKCLLISWLQSPSALILEPRKIKNLSLFALFPHLFAMK